MKKIAIMTWYMHRNYGTALQACATGHIVKKLGYSPSFIQYIPQRGAYRNCCTYFSQRCVNKAKLILNPRYTSDRFESLFVDFLSKRISQTSKCSSYAELHDLNDQYDAFLCGSDQIWTPLNHDDKYFLSFVQNPHKMVAYAPSVGVSKIADPLIGARMKILLDRFQHLSIREQHGAELIQGLIGRRPHVVLDPTLLMDAPEWDKLADVQNSDAVSEQKYIICYFLGNANKYMRYVRALSAKMNMSYYLIPVTQRDKKDKHAVPFEVGPREFVSLIRGAQYVCTDSFHGIAFAVNYNIPFSVFKRFNDRYTGSQNSRVFNLLNVLHLQSRLCEYQHTNIHQDLLTCDFSEANNLLEKQRRISLMYLEKSLEIAVNAKSEKRIPTVITDTCCGCGACASVCPKKAIVIKKNSDGFECYSIDCSKCIHCGLCRKVCPMTSITAPEMQSAKALYAVRSASLQVLKKSASGGIGHELASFYSRRGYAVCGCVYDTTDNLAKHIWIFPDEEEKLHLLQGSKYIQSTSVEALKEIATISKKQRIIFLGTPCQAAAVDKLLRHQGLREQALIVDLICHGVPSYHLWNNFLHYVDREYGVGKHPEVVFRDEAHKWQRRIMRISGNGHVYKKQERIDDFYAFFRRGLCDMNSCFECPYRKKSAADIRIGDYWGRKFEKEEYGVSMVIVNTSEGEKAVYELRQEGVCNVQQCDLEEYWSIQNTTNPAKVLVREQLLSELKDLSSDIHKLRKKYCFFYDLEEFILELLTKIKR